MDNWPGSPGISGMELMKSFEEHLAKFKLEIKIGQLVNSLEKQAQHFLVRTESGSFESKTVIIATGRYPRHLEAPGEKELQGRGVSYCSICDAPFFKDKKVVVVGGGNTGFETALDLAKYAQEVLLFERTKRFKADAFFEKKVKANPKIKIFLETTLKEIKGKGKVEAIIAQNTAKDKTYQEQVDGVFVAIGSAPQTAFLKDVVDLNEKDEVKVESETCQTSLKGVFAAGDVVDIKFKQIIIAASQGCRAALAVYDYLQKLLNKNTQ